MASIIKLDANEHPIKSVAVFKANKAEVVRIFKVSLEVGPSPVLCCSERTTHDAFLRRARVKYRFAISLVQSTQNLPVSPVLVTPNYSTSFAPSAPISRRSTARVPPKKSVGSMRRRASSRVIWTPSPRSLRRCWTTPDLCLAIQCPLGRRRDSSKVF